MYQVDTVTLRTPQETEKNYGREETRIIDSMGQSKGTVHALCEITGARNK
jgi:hypothetical protein